MDRARWVVAIVPVIDCGDRVALAIEITKSRHAPPVLGPIERVLEALFGDRCQVPDGLEPRQLAPPTRRAKRPAHKRVAV